MCMFGWIGQQILIVWDFICLVWAWFGTNSGQIQIIIAVAALIYAWKAYRKVLHQIDISNKQTEISIDQNNQANEQRALDLKIKILDEMFNCLKTSGDLEVELKDLMFGYSLLKRDLENEKNNDNKTSLEAFERIIKSSKESVDIIRSNNNKTVNIIHELAKTSVFELETLNAVLTESMLLRELSIKTQSGQKLIQADIKKYRSTMSN